MENKNFEDILIELKQIINKLEDNNPKLDEIVKLYKKGMELIKIANKKMKNAKSKINIISENNLEEF